MPKAFPSSAISTVGSPRHAMRKHIPSGVWELFIPGLGVGHALQVRREASRRPRRREVRSLRLRRRECRRGRPTSSPISTPTNGTTASGSPTARSTTRSTRPLSIYEMHLGSWRRDPSDPERWLSYREIAPQLVEYCQKMGFTHVRADAGQRASVHRQLGLPDGRLLRRHQPLRHAARLHVLRRSAPPERHRRDHRLGAGPLPQGRPRPAPVRRHRAATSTPIPARASIPTGAR